MWGSIITLPVSRLYRRLLPRRNQRRTPAALLTPGIVLPMVILPLALIAASLTREAALVYAELQSGELNPALYFSGVFDALPGWITVLLDRFGMADFSTLRSRLTAALAMGSKYFATQASSLCQDTFEFFASLFLTLYLAFF